MPAAIAGKSFKTDADGFIHNWVVLDPIPLTDVGEHVEEVEKPMFAREYFKDELGVMPVPGDKEVAMGQELQWRDVGVTEGDFQIDLAQFATDHNKNPESCLFWGVAYVDSPEELKGVKLAIGSDDSSLWWVNGQEVIRVYDVRGVTQDDNVSDPLTLHKGMNVVRFAVIQGDGPSGACARFLDGADKPVMGVRVMSGPS